MKLNASPAGMERVFDGMRIGTLPEEKQLALHAG